MKRFCVSAAALPLLAIALLVASCGPPGPPELVAIAYVRATSEGDPDTAVQLVDIERVADRVEAQIAVVHSRGGPEIFLADSIEALVWGLYRETRVGEFAYNAPPADIEGTTARVVVTRTPREGEPEDVEVYLSETDRGWRVSGKSLDRLVTFVIQRLQERY